MTEIQFSAGPAPHFNRPKNPHPLMEKACEMEAAFLGEMLSHIGPGTASDSFGGGIGEEQFSSFLRNEHAKLLVERGGIGLAESLFRAMGGNVDEL